MRVDGKPIELPFIVVLADAARKIGNVNMLQNCLDSLQNDHGIKLTFVRKQKPRPEGGASNVRD